MPKHLPVPSYSSVAHVESKTTYFKENIEGHVEETGQLVRCPFAAFVRRLHCWYTVHLA